LRSSTFQEFVGQEKQRERGANVAKNARQMVAGRFEDEGRVIDEVSQPLDRPVEIRRRCVDKKKMLERLGSEPPAPDERIAQDQGGIVPDEIVSQGWRIGDENDDDETKSGQEFFQRERLGWTEAIRCASRFGKCLSRIYVAFSGAWLRWS